VKAKRTLKHQQSKPPAMELRGGGEMANSDPHGCPAGANLGLAFVPLPETR
jgi:hypothetical protein